LEKNKSQQKEDEYFLKVYKKSDETQYWTINLDGNNAWLLGKLGVTSQLIALNKKIESLQRARFQLQRAALPQLVANLKPEMLDFIKKHYPTKAFKEWPVRDEFDDWYGWEACIKAFQALVADGEITYKRGWNRLAQKEAPKVAQTTEKAEVVA
jgi:hypothetical protein